MIVAPIYLVALAFAAGMGAAAGFDRIRLARDRRAGSRISVESR